MLQGVERLRRELDRVSRRRSAAVTPTPGGPAAMVSVGDAFEFHYEGEPRRVRVLAITPWGLRCWDEDRSAVRSFRFDRIGAGEPDPVGDEMDAAAQE